MNFEMDLSQFEEAINYFSRRYAPTLDSIDEFKEVGRATAWETFERNKRAKVEYIHSEIQKRMLHHLRHVRESRVPPVRVVSGEPKNQEVSNEIMNGDSADSLLDFLREKYGREYLKGIENESNPKAIVRKVIRTTIEDIAKIPPEKIHEEVTWDFFRKMKLQRFLWVYYRNSPVQAVMDAYPDTYVPWNFKRAGRTFWAGEQGKKNTRVAMEWFAKKKGIYFPEDCRKISTRDFREEGLIPMLHESFNDSVYLALRSIVPSLKPWQAHITPKYFFDSRENRYNAILEYLIEEGVGNISQMTPEEIFDAGFKFVATNKRMREAGLREVTSAYEHSNYKMFMDLFPDKLHPWFIKGAKEPWKEDPFGVAADAIRWLFEKYLNVPIAEIPSYASDSLFWKVGFSGILTNRRLSFNSSPFAAVDNAYPGRFDIEEFNRYREIKSIL